MAKYSDGVLGSIKGKIGPVVGSSWKDIPYLRSSSISVQKQLSQGQLVQQAKFALVSKFIHSISKMLESCYPATGKMTGTNNAFSRVYHHAITREYPHLELDGSRILVSLGELHNGGAPSVVATGNGQVQFSWADNSDGLMALKDDRSVPLLYCPGLKQSIYTLSGAPRNAGTCSLDAKAFRGKEVDTWISFRSAVGMLAASSIYTGKLAVQ